MLSDNLNFREVGCDSPSENFTPTSERVASSGSHQHLGFKKGMAIASLNSIQLRSLLVAEARGNHPISRLSATSVARNEHVTSIRRILVQF